MSNRNGDVPVAVPELVLPAGSLRKLRFALAYGADAVYVGAAGFSMRSDESSFTVDQLAMGVQDAQAQGKKVYVGINCMMQERDLDPLAEWLEATRHIPMDALIVSDLGAMSLVEERRPDLAIHVSTQMSTANSRAAGYLNQLGAKRVVLARECTLADAAMIARDGGAEVEIFVHGAMCVAVSGRCLLSAHLCGQSGSRGSCKHSCRWEWQLVEQKRPGESIPVFESERGTIFLGSTDLCLVEYIPDIVRSGVRAVKVEGRMKSEHYVAAVARVYRAALDAYAHDPDGYSYDPAWMTELESVSHRPFAPGFAFGYPGEQPEALQTHNQPVSTHDVVGYVESRSAALHTIAVKHPFKVDHMLSWIAPEWQGGEVRIAAITGQDHQPLERAHCGTTVQVRLSDGVQLPPFSILRRRKAVGASS